MIELVLCPRAVLKCEKLWSVRKAVRYALVVTDALRLVYGFKMFKAV